MDHISIWELEELLNRQPLCNGSSVRVKKIDNNIAIVKLEGACTGCPGARITLGDVIEAVIKEHIPTIKEVVLDSSCSEELITFVKQLLNHGGQVAS